MVLSVLTVWQLPPGLSVGKALETIDGRRLLVSLTSNLPASPTREHSTDQLALT